jgi:hypothetical protein
MRREGYRPVRADQDSTLHPALRGVLDGQPEFASWTPSSLCFYYADTISVGNRNIAEKNARKPQMLAVWSLPSVEQRSGARRDLVLELIVGSSRLSQAVKATRLSIRQASSAISQLPESEDELHNFRIGKTRLVWTGRAAGDSSRIEHPIKESWLVRGASGTTWGVALTLRPLWHRPLVGALRVEGKDDLAKALKSSPIRFVGPRYLGGSADLLFSR